MPKQEKPAPNPQEKFLMENSESLVGLTIEDQQKMTTWLGVGTDREDPMTNKLLLDGMGVYILDPRDKEGIPFYAAMIAAKMYDAQGNIANRNQRSEVLGKLKEKLGGDDAAKKIFGEGFERDKEKDQYWYIAGAKETSIGEQVGMAVDEWLQENKQPEAAAVAAAAKETAVDFFSDEAVKAGNESYGEFTQEGIEAVNGLAEALIAGEITQEQANQLLAKLPEWKIIYLTARNKKVQVEVVRELLVTEDLSEDLIESVKAILDTNFDNGDGGWIAKLDKQQKALVKVAQAVAGKVIEKRVAVEAKEKEKAEIAKAQTAIKEKLEKLEGASVEFGDKGEMIVDIDSDKSDALNLIKDAVGTGLFRELEAIAKTDPDWGYKIGSVPKRKKQQVTITHNGQDLAKMQVIEGKFVITPVKGVGYSEGLDGGVKLVEAVLMAVGIKVGPQAEQPAEVAPAEPVVAETAVVEPVVVADPLDELRAEPTLKEPETAVVEPAAEEAPVAESSAQQDKTVASGQVSWFEQMRQEKESGNRVGAKRVGETNTAMASQRDISDTQPSQPDRSPESDPNPIGLNPFEIFSDPGDVLQFLREDRIQLYQKTIEAAYGIGREGEQKRITSNLTLHQGRSLDNHVDAYLRRNNMQMVDSPSVVSVPLDGWKPEKKAQKKGLIASIFKTTEVVSNNPDWFKDNKPMVALVLQFDGLEGGAASRPAGPHRMIVVVPSTEKDKIVSEMKSDRKAFFELYTAAAGALIDRDGKPMKVVIDTSASAAGAPTTTTTMASEAPVEKLSDFRYRINEALRQGESSMGEVDKQNFLSLLILSRALDGLFPKRGRSSNHHIDIWPGNLDLSLHLETKRFFMKKSYDLKFHFESNGKEARLVGYSTRMPSNVKRWVKNLKRVHLNGLIAEAFEKSSGQNVVTVEIDFRENDKVSLSIYPELEF